MMLEQPTSLLLFSYKIVASHIRELEKSRVGRMNIELIYNIRQQVINGLIRPKKILQKIIKSCKIEKPIRETTWNKIKQLEEETKKLRDNKLPESWFKEEIKDKEEYDDETKNWIIFREEHEKILIIQRLGKWVEKEIKRRNLVNREERSLVKKENKGKIDKRFYLKATI